MTLIDAPVLNRYAALIESALPPIRAFVPESEGPAIVQVERGGVLRLCLDANALPLEASSYVDRLIELSATVGQSMPDIVDRGGHRRPGYLVLLVYAWIQACRLVQEKAGPGAVSHWEPALIEWCKRLEADAVLPGAADTTGIPAASGAAAVSACWAALSLYMAGLLFPADYWLRTGAKPPAKLAEQVFAILVANQQASGALLLAGRSDNPETYWYHELVILHAAASYAVQAGDAPVAAAVARAANYHLAETQPDHATTQPWALFAFISNPGCRPLADEMLHNAAVQSACGSGDGVGSILLADALYCLRLYCQRR